MPTTKTITLYQYDELPKKAQEKAREWYRQGESQDWEPSWESFTAAAKLLGIDIDDTDRKQYGVVTVPDIRYSGFYSQGDGASFVGSYKFVHGCSAAIREEFPQDTTLHQIADELTATFTTFRLLGKEPGYIKITQDGRYVHERTMGLELPDANESITAEDEERILESMRDFAKWIYSGLRQDYEWRLEDEQIIDGIRANEYTFTEDGERED